MFWLKQRIGQLHSDQSGAIMLLLMAAFLILFMVAMTLYDTGMAARDKMDAQIAADASAFSHSVVKSRSMNMISYANIIKRMVYTWSVSYINGFFALVAVTGYHMAQCFKWFPRIKSCIELATNAILIIAEVAEAYFSGKSLSLWGSSGKAGAELIALERYQQYMMSITPWWAWAENVTRSMDNGAMATLAWPPPPSAVDEVKSAVSSAGGLFQTITGDDVLGMLPSFSTASDALPIARRDRIVDWTTPTEPYNFSLSRGTFRANMEYCMEWTGSLEQLVVTIQTATSEAGGYEYWRAAYLFLQFTGALAGASVGCGLTGLLWGRSPISSAHLDFKLNNEKFDDENTWTNATSSLTVSYRPRTGRNSDSEHRKKFNIIEKDYNSLDPFGIMYKNEGYYGMAKSEIVYKPSIGTDASGFLGGVAGIVSSIPVFNSRLGVQDEPDMWSPRWTAKLRPVTLPGEEWGSASSGDRKAGFNTVVNDSLPYILLASVLGFLDEDFSFGSGARDAIYLYQAGSSADSTKVGGFVK